MTARFSSIAFRSSGSIAASSSRRSSSATAASYSADSTVTPRSATVTAGAVSPLIPESGSSTAPVIGSSERGAEAVGPRVTPPSRTAIQTAPADRSAIGPTASAPRSEEPITGAVEEPIRGAVEEPISGAGGETAPAVTVADRGDPVANAEYENAVAELERLLDEANIDPEIRQAIDQNLAVIDDAIRQTRRALEEDPDDVYLNTHLASTMQRKVDLLQNAARLARAST